VNIFRTASDISAAAGNQLSLTSTFVNSSLPTYHSKAQHGATRSKNSGEAQGTVWACRKCEFEELRHPVLLT
jgi:hypothetical protein